MRRRARLGRYFTFARQSPVTFLSGTKDAFSNGDRQHTRTATAGMLVPEAPSDLDYRTSSSKHDIRRSGEVAPVQSETVAHRVEHLTDREFRLRVLGPDRRH